MVETPKLVFSQIQSVIFIVSVCCGESYLERPRRPVILYSFRSYQALFLCPCLRRVCLLPMQKQETVVASSMQMHTIDTTNVYAAQAVLR